MATAHEVAAIRNSCYKPPINPHTGLVSSSIDVDDTHLSNGWGYHDTGPGIARNNASKSQLSRSVNFDTTNEMMDTINVPDLAEMTDEEFYARLTSLKAEHKKTLQLCEKLYNEKIAESKTGTGLNDSRQIPVASVDPEYILSTNQVNGSPAHMNHSYTGPSLTDHVRDMSSSKPPTGKLRKSGGTPSPSKTKSAWTDSHDDSYWQARSFRSSDGESGDELDRSQSKLNRSGHSEVSRASSKLSSLSRIEDMWERFSVDEYAPRPKSGMRARSNSMSRLQGPSKENETRKSQEWRNRITIPKPFNMTLRDSNKTPNKSAAMEELERKREEELRREEEECQKKFKAKPVPAHVYMPLFEEIMEEKERKRRYVQRASAEMLKSSQKPFKFDVREEEKKKFRRSHSSPVFDDTKKKPKTTFKANPFPEHLFEGTVSDRMKEEEEYRKIRIQMRAEELLHSSSLPPNMKAKGKEYTEGKLRQKLYAERAKRAGFTSEHKFQPRVNDDIPDFEDLHRKFMTDAMRRKQAKEATVCKPFKLNTAKIATKRHKIYEDIAKDEESLKESRWPFKSYRGKTLSKSALSTSMDSIPTKMTASAHLRSSATQSKMQSQIEKELQELERERRRRQRERELKKYISERALNNDNTCILENASKRKLEEFRQAERARLEEYKQQLNEMSDRVQKRPLLFERTMQENAKNRVDRKYKETLQNAGLDEDFIAAKSRGAEDVELDSEDDDYSQRYSSHHDSVRSVSHHNSMHSQSHHSTARSHSLSGSRRYTDPDDGASDITIEDDDYIEEDVVDEN